MGIIAERIERLSESATLKMATRSREMQAEGIDVINLSIGEPDFNTPGCVKEAAFQAIRDNHTHYTPVPGIPALRKAIAEKLKRENGLDYSPDQIVVSNGAKQSIVNAILAVVNPGDEVIVPAPYWVSYPDMISLAGGTMITVETSIEQEFKMLPEQLAAAITPRTKLLMINSPNNPSGAVYSMKELEALARVLAEHPNVYILSDEIYEYINFAGKHASFASFPELRDRVILINGVSKGYAMTGWRIGYLAAVREIAAACNKLQGQTTSGASSISQYAALAAISSVDCSSEEVATMVEAFRARRQLVIDKLKAIPGVIPNDAHGAFYVFPNIAAFFGKSYNGKVIRNAGDLCLYLLENAHVATVDGTAFGNDRCIRISYATGMELLETAMDRIAGALSELR
ncbi:MAG: pyridoxal phosphate-dependent aminotransferase [Bacteroidales bacterium]